MRQAAWVAGALVLTTALAAAGYWWARPRLWPDPLVQGLAAYQHKNWQEASARAMESLSKKPGDRESLRLLARSAARLGRDDSAQGLFSRIGPEAMRAEDYYLLAAGLIRQNARPEVARSALEIAHREDPNHPEVLQELARLLVQNDELEQATPLMEQLARSPGWEARGNAALAVLLQAQHDPSGAAQAFERALKQDPKLTGAAMVPTEARKVLARDLLAIAKPAEAREQLKIVRASRPDPEIYWLLSRAYLQAGTLEEAAKALAQSHHSGGGPPLTPEPAPYLGAARCAACHPANYRLQQNSRHARTFHRSAEVGKLKLPTEPLTDPFDAKVVHTLKRDPAGQIQVETQDAETHQTLRALVEYALGSGDRGVTFVGRDEYGLPWELRISYYNDGSVRDRTTGHHPNPGDRSEFLGKRLSPREMRLCLGCHTTNYRAVREQVGPEAADHAIGCERCHGPGGNHLAAVEADFADLAIGRPKLASAAQINTLCGQCHSPGHEISPADPTLIRFQALTLPKSRCYAESQGALSCLTCHNPHANAETDPGFYEAKCLACHSSSPPPERLLGTRSARLAAEIPRTPCPVNPRQDCLKCHMPSSEGVVPHTPFTNHWIRVPQETSASAGPTSGIAARPMPK